MRIIRIGPCSPDEWLSTFDCPDCLCQVEVNRNDLVRDMVTAQYIDDTLNRVSYKGQEYIEFTCPQCGEFVSLPPDLIPEYVRDTMPYQDR